MTFDHQGDRMPVSTETVRDVLRAMMAQPDAYSSEFDDMSQGMLVRRDGRVYFQVRWLHAKLLTRDAAPFALNDLLVAMLDLGATTSWVRGATALWHVWSVPCNGEGSHV